MRSQNSADLVVYHSSDPFVSSRQLLSLTGYEPKFAKELATDESDSVLENIQQISDQHKITIENK